MKTIILKYKFCDKKINRILKYIKNKYNLKLNKKQLNILFNMKREELNDLKFVDISNDNFYDNLINIFNRDYMVTDRNNIFIIYFIQYIEYRTKNTNIVNSILYPNIKYPIKTCLDKLHKYIHKKKYYYDKLQHKIDHK